jgi:V/A-type H+-transporting ATPase subunit I
MRLVTVICRQCDAARALEQLRDLGVLHLLPQQVRASSRLDRAQKQRDSTAEALALLPADRDHAARGADLDAVAADVLRLGSERREREQQRAELAAERLQLLPFGDFDPAAVVQLRQHGIALKFYLLNGKGDLPPAPEGCALEVLGRTATTAAAVLVGPPAASLASAALAVREVPLPVRSLAAVERELAANAARDAEIEARLRALAAHRPALAARGLALDEEIELLRARAGMNEEPDLCWLGGACPADLVPQVEAAAAEHGWATAVREPGPDDPVPTLLRSPGWVEQIHSVLQMLGITPGYAEPDSSALFLLFLVLFAAMLIGDAGYGTLLLVATFFVARGRPSQPVRLLRTIACATIGWGAITGTWFAIPTLPAFLDLPRIEWLTGPDPLTARSHVMLLCFLLGAVHLTVAHGWAALRSWKSLTALAQLGWIACTWFMFAIARHMVLGEHMPSLMWTVLAVGVALIVLFMTPPAKFKDEWFNHVMLPLSLVSNFVDVVSYLRLFAVGVAGFEVAKAFNNMAADAASGGSFGYATGALIAVFGHSLNLALCAMGVLVHGVRLNTLEFSAHLGLQWNGFSYRPFARRLAALTPRLDPSGTTNPEA